MKSMGSSGRRIIIFLQGTCGLQPQKLPGQLQYRMLSLWSPNDIVIIIAMSLARYLQCSHTILLLDNSRKIADIPEIDRNHVWTHPEIVRTGIDSLLQYAPSVQTFGIPRRWKTESRAGEVVDEEKLHGGIPPSNNLAGLVVGQ